MGQKGRNRKSRSHFRSGNSKVVGKVKKGSAIAKRSGVILHPTLYRVDADELLQELRAERYRKESA